jgi:O-antigen/teichoic acid export membrane protein
VAKTEIRVQYSGFVIFASQIISLFTGVVFTLLLTRNMGTDEFGAWSFIFYVIGLFTLFSGLFPFWATRFVARGKEGSVKTAIVSNFMVALAAMAVYLLVVTGILNILHVSSVSLSVFLLAALQIINLHLVVVFEACLRSIKPQATGYGLLVEEIVKVGLAFGIFLGTGQLFYAAIIGVIVGASVQIGVYAWLLREQFRQRIHFGYVTEWLKGSAALVYNVVGIQLVGVALYFLVHFGGESALGDYQAAVTFSTVIGYAGSLAFALYPRMLAKECPEDIIVSFKNMLMLALPMATVALTMATSLLTILNASYNAASPILVLLTIDALIVLVLQFYTLCLIGTETLDAAGKISFGTLAKSKIFKVFSLPYIQAAIALPAIYWVLAREPLSDPVQAALYVVGVYIGVHAISFVGIYWLMRREFSLAVPWMSLAKYAFAALITTIILIAAPQTTTLVATFIKALVGAGVYAVLLLIIDSDARKLAKNVAEEIESIIPMKRRSAAKF